MTNAADYPRIAEDAFNRRDLDALAALWHPDFHYRAPGQETATRVEARAREQALWEAFPDMTADLSRHLVVGDRLVIEGVLAGTHRGTLRLGDTTLAPTGRPVRVQFVAVFAFSLEGARDERVYYDRLDLLEQLGLAGASS